jgi:hypothetical protein
MAKAPRPGAVKTRLAPPLTSEQAAGLSISLLRDTLESIAAVVAPHRDAAAGLVSYTPLGDEALFDGLLPQSFTLVPQRGEGFGERLRAAAHDILALGFASVCLIDSDSPTVPQAAYQQAIAELARPGDRIVLGPAIDGGYYLIGLKHPHAAVFERIHWSTGSVAAETRERARAAGLEVVELPLWYDVDDAATLEIVKAELLGGLAPGFAPVPGYPAPRTRDFLLAQDSAPRDAVRTDANAVAARDEDPREYHQ